jgi:hypothetical protein
MARIITQQHEDVTRALLQASLQTRELGYTDAAGYQELVILTEGGQYRHFPSLERLDDAASALSGAALIGFYPTTAGMSATNVQAAIEELQASSGGGGTLTGSGTVNTLMLWTAGTVAGNSSILSEVSGRIRFSGDADANLYRLSAGILATEGSFNAIGTINSVAGLQSDYLEIGINGRFYGDIVVDGDSTLQGVQSLGYLATPIITTAAATLTLDLTHHTVRTTHASANITLPDSTTVPAGTEFYVFPQENGITFTGNGTDVWRGLNRELGLGIEDDPDPTTYVAPARGFMLKTDGAGHWYIWEL